MSSSAPDGPPGYPRDEFDRLEPHVGRRGAHRAKPSPVLAMLPVLLVVIAVVAVLVGAMTLLGGNDRVPPAASGTPPPTAAPGTPPSSTDPDATSPAPGSETSPPADAPVDPSVPVVVLNGTRTTGLAGNATDVLTEQGWAVPEAGNYRDGQTPPTTVFYPREDLAATAAAVAEDLGGAETALSEDFGDDVLTVVLGEDYES